MAWVDGKTVISLTAIQGLLAIGSVNRVLIVAPKRVAEQTWLNESRKWAHLKNFKLTVCAGTPKKRTKILAEEPQVMTISRGNFVWLTKQYPRDTWPFDTVVIDELTTFKSYDTSGFKALKGILPHVNRRVGLTGTPAPNGLEDLWAEIYFLDEGQRLGKYVTYFRQEYFNQSPYSRFVRWPRADAQEKIMDKLQDLCVSMEAEDYLNMPELILNKVKTKLSSSERLTYDSMEKDFVAEIGNDEITATSAATVSNKLLQLCNGAIYTTDDTGDDRPYVEFHNKKLELLKELYDSSPGQPLLVFYAFKHDKKRIKKFFTGVKGCDILTLDDDKDALDRWNEGKCSMLLAHPASIAHGLNIQAGGHIICYFGSTWNLELYEQSFKRLYRQGQKSKTVILNHLMIEDSQDDVVLGRLGQKGVTQQSIIDAVKARLESVRGCID